MVAESAVATVRSKRMTQIQATDLVGTAHNVAFDVKPDKCPLCHHAIDPLQQGGAIIITAAPQEREAVLEMVFQCTRRECHHFFIGRYRRHTSQGNQMVGDFRLESTTPTQIIEPILAAEVVEVSPNFKLVYCQASAAESTGLDQIAGVGYRKALEFLIKDYCIAEDSSAAEAVKQEALGVTIANRVAGRPCQGMCETGGLARQ